MLLRPGPMHYSARQPRTEHTGTQTRLLDLQDSGGRARNPSQILRSQGTIAFSSVRERRPCLNTSFETKTIQKTELYSMQVSGHLEIIFKITRTPQFLFVFGATVHSDPGLPHSQGF
jgi:hypothetical protein